MADSDSDISVASSIPKTKAAALTPYEKSLLLDLVSDKKGVIESKKTDFGTKLNKDEAWNWIADQFSKDVLCSKRCSAKLRKSYENIKTRAKKEVTSHRKEVKKTGGGKGPGHLSSATEKVLQMIPQQMSSLQNDFDCDVDMDLAEVEVLETGPDTNRQKSALVQGQGEKKVESKTDSKAKSTKKNPEQLDVKARLVGMEEEEHQLRKRKLELEIRYMEEEHTAKMSFLKAEHELKMKGLQQKINLTPEWNGYVSE